MNQVCVRMGSNKIQINVPRQQTSLTCSQVIEIALERCKLDKSLVRTYAIFESVCGIEKKLHRSEDFILICQKSSESQEKTQFIIRKYLSKKTFAKLVPSQNCEVGSNKIANLVIFELACY